MRKDVSPLISRERTNSFILTEQLHHSIISGEMFTHWKYEDVIHSPLFPSVHHAISMHDYSWQNFDKQPFWNDAKNQPYTFMDFPMMAKLVIYQHGADEIEKENSYAALLCSHHYQNFLKHKKETAAKSFVAREEERQERIKENLSAFNEAVFEYHYGVLSLLDGLSLFAAITEPGAAKEDLGPIFKDGFSIPAVLGLPEAQMTIEWLDDKTVALAPFPFDSSFSCIFKQKEVAKESITEKGYLEAYQTTDYKNFTVQFVPLGE